MEQLGLPRPIDLPFRYAFDLSHGPQAGLLNASLALPIYSDPYFDQDFRNRSEDMDWFQAAQREHGPIPSTLPARSAQLQPKLDAIAELDAQRARSLAHRSTSPTSAPG